MIINDIANLVNTMILNLYSKGITFYQILIGLFIFNIIIFYISKLLIQARKVKFC